MATDPTLDMDDQDETEDASPVAAAPAPQATPAGPPAPAPISPPAQTPAPTGGQSSMSAPLQAYLQSQMALMADAQKRASTNRLIAGLARAGGTFANGSGTGTAGDTAAYNALDANADAPVKNLLSTQKFQADAVTAKSTQDKSDPTSVASYVARKLYIQNHPEFTEEQKEALNAASAEDIGANAKYDEVMQKTKAAQQDHADKLRSTTLAHEDAVSTRSDAKQNAAMANTVSMLEGARSQPSVMQAEKDIYAASKVNSLANLYGDPNKLNPEMVHMLVAEVGKIASGGQSTEGELNFITPKTLTGSLAGVWQKLLNAPSPANAGEFIKQYQDYANSLTKDAQKVLTDKYGRVIEARSGELGPENVQKLNQLYSKRFDSAAGEAKPSPGPRPPGSQPKAGQQVEIKGKRYRVGADGNSLEPL